MTHWENLFRLQVLNRGRDYYEAGRVRNLVRTRGGYEAQVRGSDLYDVEVSVINGVVQDSWCACPYVEEWNYCKHLAAVLYAIEHGGLAAAKNSSAPSLSQILAQASAEELRGYLLALAKEDEKWAQDMRLHFSKESAADKLAVLQEEINQLATPFVDRAHGYILYRQAPAYQTAVQKFMDRHLPVFIEQGELLVALDLSFALYDHICQQELDDSDGISQTLLYNCRDYWQEILDEEDETATSYLFQWLMTRVSDYRLGQEDIQEFLLEEFLEEECLLQKWEYFRQELEKHGRQKSVGGSCSWDYTYEKLVQSCLILMEQLDIDELEQLVFYQEHWHLSFIRKLAIQKALDREDWERAIAILKESMALDRTYPGLVNKYSRELIQIYQGQEWPDKIREELVEHIFDYGCPDLEMIRALQFYVTESEWQGYLEQLVEDGRFSTIRLHLLLLLNRPQEVLEGILNSWYRLEGLDAFEKELKERIPEALRDAYYSVLLKEMDIACSRSRYRQLVSYLKKLATYPEGEAFSRQLARTWREQFPRRKAMLEELQAVEE